MSTRIDRKIIIALAVAAFTLSFGGPTRSQTSTNQSKRTEDPSSFTEHVIVIASQDFPALKLRRTDKPLLVSWTDTGKLSLENLYRTIKEDTEPGKEEDEIRRFLKSITELHPGATSQSIPSWDDVRLRLRPQIIPAKYVNQAQKSIISKPLPFSRKLMEGYVIDSENTFLYVTRDHLINWRTDVDHVSRVAYENLDRVSLDVKFEVEEAKDCKGKCVSVAVKDGYAAARVLLPDMQRRLHRELGNPCFVAFPNRDFLVGWSDDFSHKQQMIDKVRKDFQSRHHPLTPLIYKLDESSFTAYDESMRERTPRSKRRRHRS